MDSTTNWLIGVCLGLTCASLAFSGFVLWQLKGLRFGLFAGLQKQLESLAPELSSKALEELAKLQSSFRSLETEWTSQHGAMNKIAGRIERRLQEMEGTHKGGPNSKGVKAKDEPAATLPGISSQFAQALELEKQARL